MAVLGRPGKPADRHNSRIEQATQARSNRTELGNCSMPRQVER